MALPSKAVGLMWQAFLESDSLSLLSNLLPIVKFLPVSPITTPSFEDLEALSRTYAIACDLEGLDWSQGDVPSLFELDHKVSMANGWRFVHLSKPKDGVYHCQLDQQGSSVDRHWFIHKELSRDELAKLGLGRRLSGSEYSSREGGVYAVAGLALCALVGFDNGKLVKA